MDFLDNINISHIPLPISNDDPIANLTIADLANNSTLQADTDLVQTLVNHLNSILDWRDRIDGINYLADQSFSDANNLTFFATNPDIITASTSIGGAEDGTIDLNLIKTAIALTLEWQEWTAMNSLSGGVATNA